MVSRVNSDLTKLAQQVGELHGLLKAHIKETDRDRSSAKEFREEAKIERNAAVADRRAIGIMIDKLSASVQIVSGEIGPIKLRLDKIEPIVADAKAKMAVAAAIIGGGLALVAWFLHLFSAELKAALSRLLRIS